MSGELCGICGEVEETPLVECLECGLRFHLALRKDQPGKDCGDAVLGESMGVEMICNSCIDLRRAGEDAGANLMGLYNAMVGGRLPTPPSMPPAPPPPATPPARPTLGERPRRRFRRIDQ